MADADALMLSVSGCRGVVGSTLTPVVAARFAGAFAAWVRERVPASTRPRVVIGRDGRAGGASVRDAAIAGLTAAGCDVTDLGVVTTATVGFMADLLGADAGMVVTASHNPQQWNGLKCLARSPGSAAAPDAADADRIIRLYREAPDSALWADWRGLGLVQHDDRGARLHVERVLAELACICDIDRIRARRFCVVLDSVNASGAPAARLLLDSLACRAHHLHDDDTGLFPHAPEPVAENLTGLCRAVRAPASASRADVGFAQDPDADRLAIVDETGRFIGEEYTLVIAAEPVFRAHAAANPAAPPRAAINLSTSRMLEDSAGRYSGRVLRSPVGEANVVALMRESGCVLAGEGNGGVIWPRVVSIRDSLSAMALVLAHLAQTGEPLSAIVSRIPSYAIEKRKLPLAPGMAARVRDSLTTSPPASSPLAGASIDTRDGVRFALPDAWVHVRASNTEPILRLIAEAPTPDRARLLLDAVAAAIT